MANKTTYVVGNPHDLPEGVPMISWQEHTWFEGQEFDPPKGLNIERLIAQRYLLDPNEPQPTPETEDEAAVSSEDSDDDPGEEAEVEEKTEEEVDG